MQVKLQAKKNELIITKKRVVCTYRVGRGTERHSRGEGDNERGARETA